MLLLIIKFCEKKTIEKVSLLFFGSVLKMRICACALAQNFYLFWKLEQKLSGKLFSDKNMMQNDTIKLYQFVSYLKI